MNEISVCAVIVTYNRKDLLRECINALYQQIYPVHEIIVIDNASTDETPAMVKQEFNSKDNLNLFTMNTNTGGAGGFFEGIKKAKSSGCSWIWIMDDDCIPDPDCLYELIEIAKLKIERVSFLASTVYGIKREPMNVPEIDLSCSDNGYPDWQYNLDKSIVKIKTATFVSLLIDSNAIDRVGLPCKDFFIWGDDTEYTYRLTKYYGPAFLVGKSKVMHKRGAASAIQLETEENIGRIPMYHYQFRNRYIYQTYYNIEKMGRLKWIGRLIISVKLLTKPNGILKFKTRLKGIVEGIVQYNTFKQYIDQQVKEG